MTDEDWRLKDAARIFRRSLRIRDVRDRLIGMGVFSVLEFTFRCGWYAAMTHRRSFQSTVEQLLTEE